MKVDNKAPKKISIEATANGKNFKNGDILTKTPTIVLSANADSGIAKYQYSLNGNDWIDMDGDTITITEEGFWLYNFRAVSNSGMVSEIKQIAFTYDKDYNQNVNVHIPNTEVVTTVSVSLMPVIIAAALVLVKRKKKVE